MRLHAFVAYGHAIAKSTKNIQSYRLQECVDGSSSIHESPRPGPIRPSFPKRTQFFFFGPNIGSPTFDPVRRTFAAFCNFNTTSMLGKSAPVRSSAATAATSTLAFAARSFCVIVLPFWFLSCVRAPASALATSSGTFFVATGPSARSTFVRRWPSGLLPVCLCKEVCQCVVVVVGFVGRTLTFAVENFFSVPTTAPLRCAALSALLPLIVVSRCVAPGPRALLPILVTDSQSSDMMGTVCVRVFDWRAGGLWDKLEGWRFVEWLQLCVNVVRCRRTGGE